jgi:hypothetical protein
MLSCDVIPWLAKLNWSRPLDPLWLQVLSRAQLADHEDLVTESLRHQSDRDAFEGVPDEVINIRFREIELHDRNLTPALAQLNKVGAVQ